MNTNIINKNKLFFIYTARVPLCYGFAIGKFPQFAHCSAEDGNHRNINNKSPEEKEALLK